MKSILKKSLKRISDFEFKNALFFVGVVLSIYLVTGCLLGTIQDNQARATSVVLEHK